MKKGGKKEKWESWVKQGREKAGSIVNKTKSNEVEKKLRVKFKKKKLREAE